VFGDIPQEFEYADEIGFSCGIGTYYNVELDKSISNSEKLLKFST